MEYSSSKLGFRPQSLGFTIFFKEERAVGPWKTTKEKGRDQIRQCFKEIIAFAWQFWTYIVNHNVNHLNHIVVSGMIHDFPIWYPEYLPNKLKTRVKKLR